MPSIGGGFVVRGAGVADQTETIHEFPLGESIGGAELETPGFLVAGAEDFEAGVVVGPVFGAEGGDWEVVEGVEAGGWGHGVGGGWKKFTGV